MIAPNKYRVYFLNNSIDTKRPEINLRGFFLIKFVKDINRYWYKRTAKFI